MSRGGVVVDRVVACPGIGSGQAAETLVSVVGASGDYHAVRVAADRVQFARTFRPTWATVLGWCLLPVALVGIVFFFVKTTETCIAVVEADHRGTRIRLSGRLEAAVLERLVAAFDDPAGAARDAAVAAAVGAPVVSPQSASPQFQPMPAGPAATGAAPFVAAPPMPATPPAPAAVAGPAPVPMSPAALSEPPSGNSVQLPPPSGDPVVLLPPATPAAPGGLAAPLASVAPAAPAAEAGGWVPVWERDDVEPAVPSSPARPLGFDPSSTIVVPSRHPGSASGLRALLDDGTELDLATIVLLGRDPAPGAFEDTASLVPVVDPERSVSKTHLKIELFGGVVMATDRGSTNGSVLVGSDGSITELAPGVPVEVPSGSSVRFGSRTVRVLSGVPQGGSL